MSNSGKLALQLRAAPAPRAARPITKLRATGAARSRVPSELRSRSERSGAREWPGTATATAAGTAATSARGAPGLAESGKDASGTGTTLGLSAPGRAWVARGTVLSAPLVRLPTEGPPRGLAERRCAGPGRKPRRRRGRGRGVHVRDSVRTVLGAAPSTVCARGLFTSPGGVRACVFSRERPGSCGLSAPGLPRGVCVCLWLHALPGY